MENAPYRRLRQSVYVWTSLIGVIATVLFLMPVPEQHRDTQINDTLVHAVIFVILTLPAFVAGGLRWIWIALAAFGFGLGVELVQPLTGRSFDPRDLLANMSGVALSALLAHVLRLILKIA